MSGAFDQQGVGANSSELSFATLIAAIGAGAAAFGVQFLLFNLLRLRLKRVYAPKTYLVPENERIPEPTPGLFGWLFSIFKTSNMEFIEKCGLDAYFFLRYLRMLLKIFVPTALVLLPILLPVNSVNLGTASKKGVDKFSWGNIGEQNYNRRWVHLVATLCFDIWICYVIFGELRGYIRIRQAYLTSPQHRLRASATTVLVTNISRKWLTREALDGLYDVFPGGVRNIWINRNFDELDSMVNTRDNVAKSLENLYGNLVAKAHDAYHNKQKSLTDGKFEAVETAEAPGTSIGNPHQIAQTLDEALGREASNSSESLGKEVDEKRRIAVISDVADGFGAVGQGIGQGFGAVGHGFNKFGHFVKDGVTDTFNRGKKPVTQGDGVDEKGESSSSTSSPDDSPLDKRISASDEFAAMPAAQDPQTFAAPPKQPKRGMSFPSPQPKVKEGDEYPLTNLSATLPSADTTLDGDHPAKQPSKGAAAWLSPIKGVFVNSLEETLPDKAALLQMTEVETKRRQQILEESKPSWTEYLKESDRETTHQHTSPLLNWIPYVGTKVDAIDYHTVVLAVYNKRIEELQKDPEQFELMNSAFIQFNHQIAAHMACQTLNHHVPLQMTPRTVEISPDDVKWEKLSTPWYSRYVRTTLAVAAVVGLIVAWAPLVAFTGSLSKIDTVADSVPWLGFINTWPKSARSIIQGILPPALMGLLLVLLPLVMRLLCWFQGMTTGTQVELTVQSYYFVFLFIQVFLVATLSSGLSTILEVITDPKEIQNIPSILAQQLPTAANYFFSYIILQALSASAGAILQLVNLFMLFVWSTLFDSSPRSYFSRATSLPSIQWGTFFPVYTNFAVIGIVYAVIAPLILVFVIITYSLFWIVHRYNALYVNRYTNDTGGLLFPRAVIQLFTGLYTMHICLFGLYLLDQSPASVAQAVIMAVCVVLLIAYQLLLNRHFSPLYRYMPITLEDDAVERDEEFAELQARRQEDGRLLDEVEDRMGKLQNDNLQEALRDREKKEKAEDEALELEDRKRMEERRQGRSTSQEPSSSQHLSPRGRKSSWASRNSKRSNPPDKSWADSANNDHSIAYDGAVSSVAQRIAHPRHRHPRHSRPAGETASPLDLEAQKDIEERFYHGMNDELEDLTKDERDILVNKAFRHRALRATRPAVWLPKDSAGVSDFGIQLIAGHEELRKYIWISNEGAPLKVNGKVDEKRLMRPPDFNEEKLIKL